MSPRLSCAGLVGGRGQVGVFRSLDLSVEAGRVLTLLGPNGAGKTTLLLTLAGLLPAIEGTVSVDGQVIPNGRPGAANRAGIVLVPDNRCLFGSLTVAENLEVAQRKGGPRVEAMLDMFPALQRRRDVRAESLSGGEQQMLAIGRGLIQEPTVLLIDEMSMGLAPIIVEQLFETIRRIVRDHDCAVVLVEQHVRLALGVADHGIVLSHGSIALSDDSATLLADPERLAHAYLGAAPAAASGGEG